MRLKIQSFNQELVLFCLFALVLFCQNSWVQGMFADGHLYMAFGKHAAEKDLWLTPHLNPSTYPSFEDHIPFVFILEGLFFSLFGVSYSSARIFAALFPIGTVIVLWSFLKGQKNSWRWWAIFLFVTLPPLLKKVRFPNLDFPLMFFCFLSSFYLYRSLFERRFFYACLSGLFWGFALLCKMPIAFFVPLAFVSFLILTKRFNSLLCYKYWVGILIGLVIFSTWPIALYLNDLFPIFEKYLYSTFIHTGVDGRGHESGWFDYWIMLFKQMPHVMILVGSGIFLITKKKKRENLELVIYVTCFFLALILPLSFMKFKYSHYLIPVYPFVTILASMSLKEFLDEDVRKKVLLWLLVLTSTVLLVFPLTNRKRRDTGLLSTLNFSKETLIQLPRYIGVINPQIPFYNAVNLFSLWSESEIIPLNDHFEPQVNVHKALKVNKENWGFLVDADKLNLVLSFNSDLKPIFYIKEKNTYMVVDKKLIKDEWKKVY